MKRPLYSPVASGSGTCSPFASKSATTSATTWRIPWSAASGWESNQLKLGNSAHKPTYAVSSSDQVTR